MKNINIVISIQLVLLLILVIPGHGRGADSPPLPLDMDTLKKDLSMARGAPGPAATWPRVIQYEHRTYDFKKNVFHREDKRFEIKQQPVRMIPHAVGVAEILWAICPRDKIVAFNEFAADPEFSFIAAPVRDRGPVFKSKQTELVIGYQPDLVFIVFYSGADFREKLNQAKIPYFDLGYFGTIESIKDQIRLMGRIIGEESNAAALVKNIDTRVRQLRARLPATPKPPRVLYYDEGGYIPGLTSNFHSVCDIINAVNVGAEKGIKSWAPVDNETLLSWDPDIIIVPAGNDLKNKLMKNRVLSHARAVKNKKIYEIPGVYLRVDSQFILMSANLIAGIVYENKF